MLEFIFKQILTDSVRVCQQQREKDWCLHVLARGSCLFQTSRVCSCIAQHLTSMTSEWVSVQLFVSDPMHQFSFFLEGVEAPFQKVVSDELIGV